MTRIDHTGVPGAARREPAAERRVGAPQAGARQHQRDHPEGERSSTTTTSSCSERTFKRAATRTPVNNHTVYRTAAYASLSDMSSLRMRVHINCSFNLWTLLKMRIYRCCSRSRWIRWTLSTSATWRRRGHVPSQRSTRPLRQIRTPESKNSSANWLPRRPVSLVYAYAVTLVYTYAVIVCLNT